MVKIHFVSYIVLIIIVPRVICSQNTYIRAIPLDDDASMIWQLLSLKIVGL